MHCDADSKDSDPADCLVVCLVHEAGDRNRRCRCPVANLRFGLAPSACGTARFVWNRALAEWKKRYKAGHKPSAMALKKQFNAIKSINYPWIHEIHRDAHAQPFAHLAKAWNRFFADMKAGKPAHEPKFKKRVAVVIVSLWQTTSSA